MQLVDLTQPLTVETPPYPGHPSLQVDILQTWPKDRLNTWIVRTSMHTGTHLDAPLHMAPSGWSVGEIPLSRLYCSAVIVDLSGVVKDWTVVTRDMVEKAAPDTIRPGDAVILYYGWLKYSANGDEPDLERYFCFHPGPDPALVDWLIEQRISWVGTDCPSFEHPFNIHLKRFRPDLVRKYEQMTGVSVEERFPDEHWMYAHLSMARAGIMHVDQLGGDLPQVVGRRVDVGVFPWRWVGGEASIARVVAFVRENG